MTECRNTGGFCIDHSACAGSSGTSLKPPTEEPSEPPGWDSAGGSLSPHSPGGAVCGVSTAWGRRDAGGEHRASGGAPDRCVVWGCGPGDLLLRAVSPEPVRAQKTEGVTTDLTERHLLAVARGEQGVNPRVFAGPRVKV